MSENSIEFSLSIAEQRAVGFILAWSLASLQVVYYTVLLLLILGELLGEINYIIIIFPEYDIGAVVYRIQSLVKVRTLSDKTKFGDGNLDKFENKFFDSLDF